MRKKAEKPEPRTELAQRLDAAMEMEGYTNEAWAERLGVTAGNVSHWRVGRHAPDIDTIVRIAEIAGASDYFLLTGKPDPRLILARLANARERLRQATLDGTDGADAWEQILQQPGLLSEEEREILSGDPDGLRVYLASEKGLEQFSLDADQQRVVRDLVRLLAKYRDRPGEPTTAGRAPEP